MKNRVQDIIENPTRLSEVERQLISGDGFFLVYQQLQFQFRTREDAYNFVESAYEALMHQRKYKSYNTFRVLFIRFLHRQSHFDNKVTP